MMGPPYVVLENDGEYEVLILDGDVYRPFLILMRQYSTPENAKELVKALAKSFFHRAKDAPDPTLLSE